MNLTTKANKSEENSAVRGFFRDLGPGLITGAADDDPSGISTYSVAGATFGYAPLWTALFSFPLMAAVQLMCARLGMVTGRGLASAIRPKSGVKLGMFMQSCPKNGHLPRRFMQQLIKLHKSRFSLPRVLAFELDASFSLPTWQ